MAVALAVYFHETHVKYTYYAAQARTCRRPDDADAHPRPPSSVTFPRTRARRQAEAPAPVTGRGALMSGCGPRTETHPADAPAQGSGAMMTAMTTPESGDVAARLAQASRLIRHAQSLAEKIAELTEDELARICDERGNVVPGAIAADSTNARAADR